MDDNLEYIAFYASSHGFGHLTRCLAIIEDILDKTSYCIYICSGSKQIDFAKVYLDQYIDRVKYSVQITDIGLINKENSLDVDVIKTNQALTELLREYPSSVENELEKTSYINIKLIVSDITTLAFLVGRKKSIHVVGIANFTWIDQYVNLGIDTYIIEEFEKMYSSGIKFFKYDISLDFAGVSENLLVETRCLVSRPIDKERVNQIKKECQIKYMQMIDDGRQPEILFLSLGKSAELAPIIISNFEGVVFYTEGVNIDLEHDNHKNILFEKLPQEIKDTQSFIAASDLVIAKAGWSSVSESLVAHAKLLLIEREGVDDDRNTISVLKERKLASAISIDDLLHLDYKKEKRKAMNEIEAKKLALVTNGVESIRNAILECID